MSAATAEVTAQHDVPITFGSLSLILAGLAPAPRSASRHDPRQTAFDFQGILSRDALEQFTTTADEALASGFQGRLGSESQLRKISFEWPIEPAGVAAPPAPKPRGKTGYRASGAARRVAPKRPAMLTPLALRIEAVLVRLAAVSQPMPSNPALAEVSGGCRRTSVLRSLDRLAEAGRIRIELSSGQRRAHILADGSHTDWGAFTPGHRPYSSNPRGTAPPPALIRPDYKPVADQPFRYKTEPRPLIEVRCAPLCQWPMWDEVHSPTHVYCGEKSAGGKSYCPTHLARAYGESQDEGAETGAAPVPASRAAPCQ